MARELMFEGASGEIFAKAWHADRPRYIAVLVHGYGEHLGRYEWVAETLNAHDASVYALDLTGHGRSAGERVLIEDFEPVVNDVHQLLRIAVTEYPDLPAVLIGHSMGGMIAIRYLQRHGNQVAAAVLSGPVVGAWSAVADLLPLAEIPSTPIDPSTLSRDPAVGQAYVADPLVWHGDFKRATLEALRDVMATIRAHGSYGDLPVLYLHGEDDQLVPIEPSRQGIAEVRGAGTESISYPGARHEIFNETNRDEVLADVTGFVDRVLPG